jgi:hypothetical protein
MKTFNELGTMPQIGDLIMRKNGWGETVVWMITSIIGNTYHTSDRGFSIHKNHLQSYYSPLKQETE